MGHSSRKKKKRGAAGRKAAKDHAAQHEGDQTALDEELRPVSHAAAWALAGSLSPCRRVAFRISSAR